MRTNPPDSPVEIRPLLASDVPFLWEMLYQALYVPPGQLPFGREILQTPEISRYARDWGGPDDVGFVALAAGQPVGAVWLRLLLGDRRGFGYVDETTPELSVAVLPGHRGRGTGGALIAHLIAQVSGRYPALCLSVSAGNPARRLYQRLGFVVVAQEGDSLKMLRQNENLPALSS